MLPYEILLEIVVIGCLLDSLVTWLVALTKIVLLVEMVKKINMFFSKTKFHEENDKIFWNIQFFDMESSKLFNKQICVEAIIWKSQIFCNFQTYVGKPLKQHYSNMVFILVT
jgi:hypothetical protein